MQYYLFHSEKRHGPFTLEQITSQRLPSDTKVWRQGLSDWLPPHEVPELKDELPPPEPVEADIVPQPRVATVKTPLSPVAGRAVTPQTAAQPMQPIPRQPAASTPSSAPHHPASPTLGDSPPQQKPSWMFKYGAGLLTALIVFPICLVAAAIMQSNGVRNSGRMAAFIGAICWAVIYGVMQTLIGRFAKQ